MLKRDDHRRLVIQSCGRPSQTRPVVRKEHIELMRPENYHQPRVMEAQGLPVDQQVRRRLPGQALLRRLRVCGCG